MCVTYLLHYLNPNVNITRTFKAKGENLKDEIRSVNNKKSKVRPIMFSAFEFSKLKSARVQIK